jgi:hypothetical protein
MVQSRRGVTQILEVQVHPLGLATPRFIQLGLPLPPLNPMVGAPAPPESESPHAVIEPSVLRAAKAFPVE